MSTHPPATPGTPTANGAGTPLDARADTPINATVVAEIAYLARLSFTADEAEALQHDLGRIVRYISVLQEVDVEGVPLTVHAIATSNVFREDEPRPGLSRATALEQSPARDVAGEGFFAAPASLADRDQG